MDKRSRDARTPIALTASKASVTIAKPSNVQSAMLPRQCRPRSAPMDKPLRSSATMTKDFARSN